MTEFEFVGQKWEIGDDPQQESSAFWRNAAGHRAMVTRIIIETVAEKLTGSKLAILGAGVCNDISLGPILERFESVHLFDIDADLCRRGVKEQGLAAETRIEIHGGDVTGVFESMNELRTSGPDDADINAIVTTARSFRLSRMSGGFDVVISTCLLSQLLKHAIEMLPTAHPRLVEVLQAIRLGHILMMIDLCRSGGLINLVFDFVSSDSLPEMRGESGHQLLAVTNKAIMEQNFFHGMNPMIVRQLFEQDPDVAPLVTGLKATLPWVWDATERQYAVAAIQCQKK